MTALSFLLKKVKSLRPVTVQSSFPQVHSCSGSQDKATLLSCQMRRWTSKSLCSSTTHAIFSMALMKFATQPLQHVVIQSSYLFSICKLMKSSSMWWQTRSTMVRHFFIFRSIISQPDILIVPWNVSKTKKSTCVAWCFFLLLFYSLSILFIAIEIIIKKKFLSI